MRTPATYRQLQPIYVHIFIPFLIVAGAAYIYVLVILINSPEITVVCDENMDDKGLLKGVWVFCVCLQAFLQTHSRAIEIASWSNLKSMTPSL